MKPNVGMAGTARLAAASAGLALLLAAPAVAGDRALADFIGFSEDGRYFAFEEYGVQDGSGFPYSTIYVIDLTDDTGCPARPTATRPTTRPRRSPVPATKLAAMAAAEIADLGIDRAGRRHRAQRRRRGRRRADARLRAARLSSRARPLDHLHA